MSIDVDVQYATSAAGMPDVERFTHWVGLVLKGRRERAELTIRIVGRAESAALNAQYRHKQGPTNVLSFPFESPPGLPLDLLGDIVICAELVADEAAAQGKAPESHWAHLTIHGVLHLLGFDHITPAQASEMEGYEIQVMQQLGYENPYELQ